MNAQADKLLNQLMQNMEKPAPEALLEHAYAVSSGKLDKAPFLGSAFSS